MIRSLRSWYHRRQYVQHMNSEQHKISALAAKEPWRCDRCGLVQSGEGRYKQEWWEGSNYVEVWPRADFVAMSCRDCGASITRTLPRDIRHWRPM